LLPNATLDIGDYNQEPLPATRKADISRLPTSKKVGVYLLPFYYGLIALMTNQ
jgi:hypothetical protein